MSIRHLVRKLDPDAVARVRAGTRIPPEPLKRQSKPRKADTYRAARRNALRKAPQSPAPDDR